MHPTRKAFPFRFLAVIITALLCLVLLPAQARVLEDPPLPSSELLAPLDDMPPTTVSVDEQGYITWETDYSQVSWCVPVSTLRYPLDLDTQDPTELDSARLTLTYYERQFSAPPTDPSWTLAWNGSPPDEWQEVDAIGGKLSSPETRVLASEMITLPVKMLIDGENNAWLKQHEVCPTPGCETCACSCIEIVNMQLRAAPHFKVESLSPEQDATNVPFHFDKQPDIRVKFTRAPDPKTVNKQTFEVWYYDENFDPVLVAGEIRMLSPREFGFVPAQDLLDGVQYSVQIWGQENAEDENRTEWATATDGTPLESSSIWSFWTMPRLQVELVPVQVLENETLILNKPTALKVFLRWEAKQGVFQPLQLSEVEVKDIRLHWADASGNHVGDAAWTDGSYWLPTYNAENARRKREYRFFENPADSYDKADKLASRDSVNFFGFLPLETGSYHFTAYVDLQTSRGPVQSFSASADQNVVASRRFNVFMKAVGVGSDYGKTGTTNLSSSIGESLSAMKAIYPVPSVRRPATPGAMPWYKPTTSLYLFDWTTAPAWSFPKKYLLQELSQLCAVTTGCDAMVGYVNQIWLADIGLTLPESAPQGALVQFDTTQNYSFVVAHEIGHLETFEHDSFKGDEGFWVQGSSKDRRYSVCLLNPRSQQTRLEIFNFMNQDPVESPPPERLWITNEAYDLLLARIASGSSYGPQAVQASDALVLASGGILETTGEVQLLPWYTLEPGDWREPEPGPYKIAFLDAQGQDIPGYSHTFSVTEALSPTEPGLFTFKVPYPGATAKIQIRKITGGSETTLEEIIPSAGAPAVSIDTPPGGAWQGPVNLSWTSSGSGTHHYIVEISTDNGNTWEALALSLTDPSFRLETAGYPNTDQAWVRVLATDGLRTGMDTAGPFTLQNPPAVAYVSPGSGTQYVGAEAVLLAGFRDAMDASTLNTGTFTLSGGSLGVVPGKVSYDPATYEASFQPALPLEYNTTYTAQLTTGIHDAQGQALPSTFTWSFTTEQDLFPPAPLAFSPENGQRNVALNSQVLVAWDKPLAAGAISSASFRLATASGSPVSGSVAYQAGSRTAVFVPDAALQPDTAYLATLTAGIQDLDGNATAGDYRWIFRTGKTTISRLALSGAFSDRGMDTDGDGLYDFLVVKVGVQVDNAGTYGVSARLADPSGAEITFASTQADLPLGAGWIDLQFSGPEIGGHAADGPYALTGLSFYDPVSSELDTRSGTSYRTSAYTADQFPAPLRFSGLPDQLLPPGTVRTPAFNVHSYAQHTSVSSDQLTYSLVKISDPSAGISLNADGSLNIQPEQDWMGSAKVTLGASYGDDYAQDTFVVRVGWASQVYLPIVGNQVQSGLNLASRDFWRNAVVETFDDLGSTSSWYNGWGVLVPESSYYWGPSDCDAYSGTHSGWPFASPAGAVPCGGNYLDSEHIVASTYPEIDVYHNHRIDLTLAGSAELRMKVKTNLEDGDQVCGLVENGASYDLQNYYGVCRSGVTDGWEDLVLDLANVPTLGSLLGQPELRAAIDFRSNASGNRPFGAYVDDINVRMCLRGLPCAPSVQPQPVASGSVGGYTEAVQEMALAVESNGRIHALWTGTLSYLEEDSDNAHFIFYATSTDGVSWTPAVALSDYSWDPQIVVDDTAHQTHLMYRTYDGLVYRSVAGGVLSAPFVIAPPGAGQGRMAVDPTSGILHAVWQQIYPYQIGDTTQFRSRTYYASLQNGLWSAAKQVVQDVDTAHSSIAAAPGEGVMLAWFQRVLQSSGHGIAPDDPNPARSAYGSGLGSFPLRQAVSAPYITPENDESILLTYSAGDGKFYLMTEHFMWPGHSLIYRYVWENGAWSQPLDVSGSASGFASPRTVGAAANQSLVVYLYVEDSQNRMRTESNGVLSAPLNLDQYLNGLGYYGSIATFVDRQGVVHFLVAGTKDGLQGLYYLHR